MSIRPDEVAAVLKAQLIGLKTESELEEVGTVLQVGDGVARIYGCLLYTSPSPRDA